METLKNYLPIGFVVIIAFLLQVVFLFADCRETPPKVVTGFTKAYFALDPSMGDYICEESLTADDTNAVDARIQKMTQEGQQRGLGKKYMRSIVYHIKTHTHYIDENTAEVKLHAKRRTSINPLYAHIGKFFFIGKTYPVDHTFTVVKVDDSWKVCGELFSLSQ